MIFEIYTFKNNAVASHYFLKFMFDSLQLFTFNLKH